MQCSKVLAVLFTILSGFLHAAPLAAHEENPWWSANVKNALNRAGENRVELIIALEKVPTSQREGMAFLIANMPNNDLKSLSSEFLLENVRLAYKSGTQIAWGKRIPKEIFLNHVLPYAHVNETREPWRKKFFDLCLPIVKSCKTPAEAAHKLNSELFRKLRVKYSTKRKKPHQSPSESIKQGMASCTGLSILLADACRSVGIPARLVGTAQWVSVKGNHTWVEIWDNGWHFTGACEPHPKGLNHAWFVGRAKQAKKSSRMHSIYAVSFRRTGVYFPMVWDLRNESVSAENVTDFYNKR